MKLHLVLTSCRTATKASSPGSLSCVAASLAGIVNVPAGERPFTRARAVASAFMLATIGNTQDTESGDDNRPLLIR